MDFKVTINGKTKIYTLFEGVLLFMIEEIGQWNNFDASKPLVITLEKIFSDTETLGISVKEKTSLDERIS